MKLFMKFRQLTGIVATSIAGSILHFLYDWLNQSAWIAPFSGVNESTWEHMKLLFWPMLVYAIIQGFSFKDQKDFWCVKARGILIGIASIPLLFYTYNGVVGRSPDFVNIIIFILSAIIAYVYEAFLFASGKVYCKSPKAAIAILFLVALLFTVFTFYPPQINIFKDPVSGMYGR